MRQNRTTPPAVTLILAIVAMIISGCTSTGADGNHASNSSFTVSYAGAANWLSSLDPAERQEQERDWARLALAARLPISTSQLRNDTYDTLPVRDPGFAGLARQDIGPGRYLYDGHGVLHLLVPRSDPHRTRTIGLLLDQYRTDAGADPPRTQVHYYQADAAADTIDVTGGPVEPTGTLRAEVGYVTMTVDTPGKLASFLSKTSYLSRLQVRGSAPVASGWNWPTSPDARITMADVSALQRGYTATHDSDSPLPGFSLDPQPGPRTVSDLRAVIPGLSQDMASRIVGNHWSGSLFTSADDLETIVYGALFGKVPSADLSRVGLPTNRTQLLALDAQLRGRPVYSQARYEGGLKGTEVGMDLEYADHIAKTWVSGVGTGIPAASVTGFVADTRAPTTWSECDSKATYETGRLWFGENDSAVRSNEGGVSIGQEPVRLYSRTDGPHGTEVEPSYSFGRALTWWDQNYQSMADYDPEYQRLDSIMRWSDALDWLVNESAQSVSLPRLPDSQIPSNLIFSRWYAQHTELRERSPIDFLPQTLSRFNTDSGTTGYGESLAPVPSQPFSDCGSVAFEGGISLSDGSAREADADYHPFLPQSVSRAGTLDEKSTFNGQTGAGRVKEDSVDSSGKIASYTEHQFSGSKGTATVTTTGSGRKVSPFGSLKIWRSPSAVRSLQVRFSASHGQISEDVGFQGQALGNLTVRDDVGLVTVQWSPSLAARARTVMDSIQARMAARRSARLSAATRGTLVGVLYDYAAPGGQTLHRIGGPRSPWLLVSGKEPPAGGGFVLRGGGPGRRGPAVFFGTLTHGPREGGRWLAVTPATSGHDAVATSYSAGPSPHDHQVRVTTPDGKSTTVYLDGKRLIVPADDPVVGQDGSAEGAAMLRDFPAVSAAMLDAFHGKDGLLRAVDLHGDGVAFASPDAVTLVPPDHPVAAKVAEATATHTPLLFSSKGGQLELTQKEQLTPAPGPHRIETSLEDTAKMDGDRYMNAEAFRSTLVYNDGPVITSTLPPDTKVTVFAFVSASGQHLRPDALLHQGGTWVHASAASSSSGSAPSPSPASTPGGSGTPAGSGRILLICPENTKDISSCGTND